MDARLKHETQPQQAPHKLEGMVKATVNNPLYSCPPVAVVYSH
jgi:hypothetical protein